MRCCKCQNSQSLQKLNLTSKHQPSAWITSCFWVYIEFHYKGTWPFLVWRGQNWPSIAFSCLMKSLIVFSCFSGWIWSFQVLCCPLRQLKCSYQWSSITTKCSYMILLCPFFSLAILFFKYGYWGSAMSSTGELVTFVLRAHRMIKGCGMHG